VPNSGGFTEGSVNDSLEPLKPVVYTTENIPIAEVNSDSVENEE